MDWGDIRRVVHSVGTGARYGGAKASKLKQLQQHRGNNSVRLLQTPSSFVVVLVVGLL